MHTQTEIVRQKVRGQMRAGARGIARSMPLADVAARLAERPDGRLVVVDDDGRPVGTIGAGEIVSRVLWQLAPEAPAERIMAAPVVTVAEDDFLFRALAVMRRRRLAIVPVVDGGGRLVGELALAEALLALSGPALKLVDMLTRDDSIEGLTRVKQAQVALAEALLDDDVPVPDTQLLLSEINLDLHRRALERAIADMARSGWGPPPVGFALIVMGSAGRGESFLAPDQDNGFILADFADDRLAHVDAYFAPLAERFTRVLAEIGFPLCKGNVMATNPQWRKRVSDLAADVERWIARSAPEDLLLCDILIDFRHVWGEEALSRTLKDRMMAAIGRKRRFLRDLYAIETDHKVALGWFGRLKKEPDTSERPGTINLKLAGTLPLVEAARLLSLKEGIRECRTLERLEALHAQGRLGEEEHDYLRYAFGVITEAMLRRQIEDAKAGREADDYVPEASLTRRQKDQLVAALKAVEELRGRLGEELAGTVL